MQRSCLSAAVLALSLVTLLAAGGPPARAQTVPVSYPPSRALADIAAWLQRDTPIAPGQVVDVSPSALTAVTAAQPTGKPRGFLANISSEALDPQILSHEDIASWSIPVEVDCDKRVVRLGVMTGFAGRDLRNDPKTVRAADSSWVTPSATAPLGAVVRALCDRDFRRPLMDKATLGKTPKALRAGPVLRPTETGTGEASASRPKPPTSKPPAGGGSIAVQIAASPSLPDIEGLLARFKKKFAGEMGGLTGKAATVQIGGKTINRALISGFRSNAEAGAFCKTLAGEGQACFIRR